MITKKIYFNPQWDIETYVGVEEIIQRMGWCMDSEVNEQGVTIATVNLPIEDEKLWNLIDILGEGWMC